MSGGFAVKTKYVGFGFNPTCPLGAVFTGFNVNVGAMNLGELKTFTQTVGALASPVLQKKFDRKPVIVTALIFMTIFAQLVIDLRLLGLLPANHDEDLLPILIANAGAFALTIGIGGVAIMGMIGDLIDENELTTGLRQDGLFFSARAFFAKASYSVGHLFAGISLDLYVRLPFEAVPGQLDEAILTRMGIVAGPAMAFSAVIAVFVYSRYNLTAARHREIVAELDKRNNRRSLD